MNSSIGDFLEPLPHLVVHVGQIGEGAQGPETGAQVGDAGLNLSLFPSRTGITGSGIEAILAGEGEEARIEAD